jgi:hypothetical protein
MKKQKSILTLTIILTSLSLVTLIGSIFFWVESYSNKGLIDYENRRNYHLDSLYDLNYANSLLLNFIYKENLSREQIEKLFTIDGFCYVKQVNTGDRDFLHWKNETTDSIKCKYDEVLTIKSTFIYFLLDHNKVVQILAGSNSFDQFNFDYYFKNNGIFQEKDH